MLRFKQSTATEKKPSSLANASHATQPDDGGASANRPCQTGSSAGEKAISSASAGRTTLTETNTQTAVSIGAGRLDRGIRNPCPARRAPAWRETGFICGESKSVSCALHGEQCLYLVLSLLWRKRARAGIRHFTTARSGRPWRGWRGPSSAPPRARPCRHRGRLLPPRAQ
eukprot:scaffold3623_cov81-Isochrysis_galbana.AAC.4